MPLDTAVGLSGLRDIVLDGDPAAPPLKGHSPQFSANVRCGQTAGWMKTPLGREVDLGPGHIVLDGVPALRERNTAVPRFSTHVYCGHGRPSQLLLSSCYVITTQFQLSRDLLMMSCVFATFADTSVTFMFLANFFFYVVM